MKNHVALWAGASAFFSSLLAIGIIDFFKPDGYFQLVGSLFVASVTGAAIFSKQKLDDSRREREREQSSKQESEPP